MQNGYSLLPHENNNSTIIWFWSHLLPQLSASFYMHIKCHSLHCIKLILSHAHPLDFTSGSKWLGSKDISL